MLLLLTAHGSRLTAHRPLFLYKFFLIDHVEQSGGHGPLYPIIDNLWAIYS